MPRIIKPKTKKYTLKDKSGRIHYNLSYNDVTYENMELDKDYEHLLNDRTRFNSISLNYLDNKEIDGYAFSNKECNEIQTRLDKILTKDIEKISSQDIKGDSYKLMMKEHIRVNGDWKIFGDELKNWKKIIQCPKANIFWVQVIQSVHYQINITL